MASQEIRLTTNQAYDAMLDYLDKYYQANASDDVGSLLGSMMLLADEQPVDMALWSDWLEAINRIKPQRANAKNIKLTIDDAFNAMIDYLNEFCSRSQSSDIEELLRHMKASSDDFPPAEWQKSVKKFLNRKSHTH